MIFHIVVCRGCEKKEVKKAVWGGETEPQNFQEFTSAPRRHHIDYDDANGEEFLVIRMFCCGGNTRTLNDFICASARSFTSSKWRAAEGGVEENFDEILVI